MVAFMFHDDHDMVAFMLHDLLDQENDRNEQQVIPLSFHLMLLIAREIFF